MAEDKGRKLLVFDPSHYPLVVSRDRREEVAPARVVVVLPLVELPYNVVWSRAPERRDHLGRLHALCHPGWVSLSLADQKPACRPRPCPAREHGPCEHGQGQRESNSCSLALAFHHRDGSPCRPLRQTIDCRPMMRYASSPFFSASRSGQGLRNGHFQPEISAEICTAAG